MRAHRKLTVAASMAVVLMITGIAFAACSSTATATGTGNAKALNAASVTVNAVTGTADLYPGGGAGRVYFTLTNTNPYSITFDKLSAASVTGVSGGIGGAPACTTTDLTVSMLPITGLSLQVGANTTSATENVAGVVAMNITAPDACQGALFTVTLTLRGSKD